MVLEWGRLQHARQLSLHETLPTRERGMQRAQLAHAGTLGAKASGDFGDDGPREDRPGFFDAGDDDRVNAKAAAVMVQGEAGH